MRFVRWFRSQALTIRVGIVLFAIVLAVGLSNAIDQANDPTPIKGKTGAKQEVTTKANTKTADA